MNEPQLSAEMEKQIEKVLVDMEKHYCRLNGQDDGYLVKKATMRKILATALEEQKQKVLDEVDEQLRQFQLIYGSFNSSTGDIMGYRISEHEESADVLIRYLRIKLNQLKGTDAESK